jgi:uncharacterized lipoprotein YmbA
LSADTAHVAATSKLSVAVGPVSVPSAVDRPEIVVTISPNEVKPDEFNQWAAPLENSISRVVAENLSANMGTPNVTLFPQTLSSSFDFRVAIEVQSFVSTPRDSASLDAVWSVRRTQDGKTEIGRTTVREEVAKAGYDAIAAAHSRALAHMARDIAESVRTLAQSAP